MPSGEITIHTEPGHELSGGISSISERILDKIEDKTDKASAGVVGGDRIIIKERDKRTGGHIDITREGNNKIKLSYDNISDSVENILYSFTGGRKHQTDDRRAGIEGTGDNIGVGSSSATIEDRDDKVVMNIEGDRTAEGDIIILAESSGAGVDIPVIGVSDRFESWSGDDIREFSEVVEERLMEELL